MLSTNSSAGLRELRVARCENSKLFMAVAFFSVFSNLLMLTGPLYMLQVYDRVLGSRSNETLVGLTVLVVFMYIIMGILENARGRVMNRVGARFQARLDHRVFEAVMRKAAVRPDETTASGLRDLEEVQKFISSPAFIAFFDLPWTPIFFLAIFAFHPLLGWMAIVGGVILVGVTLLNQRLTQEPLLQASGSTLRAEGLGYQIRLEAEMVQALGMREHAFTRWQKLRADALDHQITSKDVGGTFSSITKTFRLFLQSAMLGLGAWIVLRGEMTPGAMIAGSILMGRALAPVDMIVGQWAMAQRAQKGWNTLAQLLSEVPPEPKRTPLPKPAAKLDVQNLTLVPPGDEQASLRMVSFVVEPGQAVGVIGPSGSGKSSLARALTGVWRPAGGKIRLDGATLDQYDPAALGQLIGYLPQRVRLFDGSITENIAGLDPQLCPSAVVDAAKKAAAHDMILKLPEGYDTRVSANGGRLSGGQMQRIGLARAMYGNPQILVLDEPNSNLDNEGSQALNAAIRAMKTEGRSVLIMAHRPAAIQECDTLLMLDNGICAAFGAKEDVLRQVLSNSQKIISTANGVGVK